MASTFLGPLRAVSSALWLGRQPPAGTENAPHWQGFGMLRSRGQVLGLGSARSCTPFRVRAARTPSALAPSHLRGQEAWRLAGVEQVGLPLQCRYRLQGRTQDNLPPCASALGPPHLPELTRRPSGLCRPSSLPPLRSPPKHRCTWGKTLLFKM